MKTFSHNLVFLLLLSLLSACTAAEPAKKQRYFFPPLPEKPRLEYIDSYATTHDLKPEKKSFLTEYVLGEVVPQKIFATPADVAVGSRGRYYVADIVHRQIFVLDTLTYKIRTLDAPFADLDGSKKFGVPIGLATDSVGRVYVCDSHAKSVHVYDESERYLFAIRHASLKRPIAVAIDDVNGRVYVVDTPEHKVAVFSLSGEFIATFGGLGDSPTEFNYPTDVDVDSSGNIYVLDSMNAAVKVFDRSFVPLRQFGEKGTAAGSFTIAKNLAVSPMGHLYVTDSLSHKLLIFSLEGDFLLRIGGRSRVRDGISPGGFYMPRGVDVGDDGTVLVVDSFNRMMHRFQFLTPGYLAGNPIQ